MTRRSAMNSGLRSACLLVLVLVLAGCGAAVTKRVAPSLELKPGAFTTKVHHWPDGGPSAIDVMEVYDPWEPMNRNLYSFNAGFDKYFMLPVTSVYDAVLPSFVQTGVNNFIENANEVGVLVNCLLQGKMEKSAITTSRLLINSTFGVLGLWDQASKSEHLKRQHEDFGQTFGVWGFGAGPYFVMPFFGPSNVRDTAGFGGDFLLLLWEMHAAYKLFGVEESKTKAWAYSELAIRALNRRSQTAFRYHETGSPFEYELVRFIYTKKRELDISK